ncbi:MAG: glycerophosphodiester phosphodiesterase [Rhizobiales bacterium 35-68-8]|nr:MAG: glycerophosphodiester phosphodiesterase [Rhizobiales bacterium 35-68-8]
MHDLRDLIRRPIAHRGLHDAARGVIENTASAFRAAIAGGYGIELDVQPSADGVPVVFHDTVLDRLTDATGAVRERSVAELEAVRMRGTDDRILPLSRVLDLIDGRAPVFIELKSRFDGDTRLAHACVDVVARRPAPLALMSFDPDMVAAVRTADRGLLRGIVAERRYDHDEWTGIPAATKFSMAHLLHWPRSRVHFVAYKVHDLSTVAPRLARAAGMPVLTWTVRTAADRRRADMAADQMIFEGFTP